MERSNATYVRYLRLLIAHAKNLSDRSRSTDERELTRLKRGALTCLAELGPKVERIQRRVAQLEFRIPYRTGSRGTFNENRAYETLDDILNLLKTALRIILNTRAIESVQTTYSPAPKISPAPANSPYSEADAKLYALIGHTDLQTLTNPELWKRYRRTAEKEVGRKLSGHAFRAMVNRVRKHHKIPPSQSLRKKLTSKRHLD